MLLVLRDWSNRSVFTDMYKNEDAPAPMTIGIFSMTATGTNWKVEITSKPTNFKLNLSMLQ